MGRGRWRRVSIALVALSLAVAACEEGASPFATTTAPPATSSTLATTTTDPNARIELRPNGEVFIARGARGPFVAALQFLLVCTGHGQLVEDGPSVTVDGVYGPITANAVAYVQAELRRIPTGEPDEETFATLARDCNASRNVTFPEDEEILGVAGNVTAGDDDLFIFPAEPRQRLTVTGSGDVEVTITGADGSQLKPAEEGLPWSGELPTRQDYIVRVSAATTTSYALDLELPPPPTVTIDFGPMQLRSDGLAVALFGDDPAEVLEVLAFVLGGPDVDSGWQTGAGGGFGNCDGEHRHLTWVIQPAASASESQRAVLIVDFSDTLGARAFTEYQYFSGDSTDVDSGARGLATAERVTIGSTLTQFTAAYGDPAFLDEEQGLALTESGLLVGLETPPPLPADENGGEDTQPEDRVWLVGAGDDGCPDFG